ncbi:MAG TPA: helical backbone metal receptor [Limnochordales bacterium]
MRVISLCPSNTEMVCALGLENLLVGVDRWSLQDPALCQRLPGQGRGVADVGTDLHIDLDAIRALKPDLVLASLSVPGMERNVARLEDAGLPHLVVDGHSLAGVQRGILQVAEALGALAAGRALVAQFAGSVAEVRARAQDARRRLAEAGREMEIPRRAAWEWWPKPVIVAGRRSWIHEFFEILGVENVFADLDQESQPVQDDEVLRRAPDTLCASWCGSAEKRMSLARIARRPGWRDLPAWQARRVFFLPERLVGRPGPSLVSGLKELYEMFYGDREAAMARAVAAANLDPDAAVWPHA